MADWNHPQLYNSISKSDLKIPFQKVNEVEKGIYIHRADLIKTVFDFVQEKNGLLVGGPGFGKSFLLEELSRYCSSRSIPCFIIRINDLTEGTNDEIGEELKIDKEWLTILARIDAGNDKSILIFDAYDTAKDEKLKSNIIRAIKKSIVELSNTWRIVVSVRTYDAIKSRKLLELFPTDNINNQVSCRNFQIPALTEQEVEEAFDLLPGFESIYQKSNIELKKLLKTPYFLNMFYYVLIGKKGNFSAFNSIESEEQLLNVFWISSIEDSFEKGLFLRNLTLKLAESGSLSYDKFQILEENHKNVFNDLISSGILEEVSVMKKRFRLLITYCWILPFLNIC
ncbi:ATP-binding protein [Chryseobacterium sp. 3008163]|uniref:ATP-binding protein n=1 Tax=Chryseobacterium sp. 3008163 TaxID=2478663 RepID=UPI001013CC79|nr:ATP-binding protein [Chryseobacterium sp. 3008163]